MQKCLGAKKLLKLVFEAGILASRNMRLSLTCTSLRDSNTVAKKTRWLQGRGLLMFLCIQLTTCYCAVANTHTNMNYCCLWICHIRQLFDPPTFLAIRYICSPHLLTFRDMHVNFTFSLLIFSGMTTIQRYPLTAAANANPIPIVLL